MKDFRKFIPDGYKLDAVARGYLSTPPGQLNWFAPGVSKMLDNADGNFYILTLKKYRSAILVYVNAADVSGFAARNAKTHARYRRKWGELNYRPKSVEQKRQAKTAKQIGDAWDDALYESRYGSF